MNMLCKAIVSLGFVGYLKPASGTIGSAAAGILLYLFWPDLAFEWKLLIITLTFLVGCYCADRIEKQGSLHDPHFVVIDEAVGMMITGIFLGQVWQHWLLAFLLFRFFDIAKIWPASIFDKQAGGFAIMIDDVIMAAPALVLTTLALPYL